MDDVVTESDSLCCCCCCWCATLLLLLLLSRFFFEAIGHCCKTFKGVVKGWFIHDFPCAGCTASSPLVHFGVVYVVVCSIHLSIRILLVLLFIVTSNKGEVILRRMNAYIFISSFSTHCRSFYKNILFTSKNEKWYCPDLEDLLTKSWTDFVLKFGCIFFIANSYFLSEPGVANETSLKVAFSF